MYTPMFIQPTTVSLFDTFSTLIIITYIRNHDSNRIMATKFKQCGVACDELEALLPQLRAALEAGDVDKAKAIGHDADEKLTMVAAAVPRFRTRANEPDPEKQVSRCPVTAFSPVTTSFPWDCLHTFLLSFLHSFVPFLGDPVNVPHSNVTPFVSRLLDQGWGRQRTPPPSPRCVCAVVVTHPFTPMFSRFSLSSQSFPHHSWLH